jgi:uncharacterized protein YbjT (DUF2867 family)
MPAGTPSAPARATRTGRPDLDWVRADVDDPDTLRDATRDATALVYLVHRMHDAHGPDLACFGPS